MTPAEAAWVRDEVIGGYHYAVWTDDVETSTPANEGHRQCEPAWVPDEPYKPSLCFGIRRLGWLVGTVRLRTHWADGYPWARHEVWLAHGRNPERIAEHARAEAAALALPDTTPMTAVYEPGQIDLFEVLT